MKELAIVAVVLVVILYTIVQHLINWGLRVSNKAHGTSALIGLLAFIEGLCMYALYVTLIYAIKTF